MVSSAWSTRKNGASLTRNIGKVKKISFMVFKTNRILEIEFIPHLNKWLNAYYK